jgi:hypothetical protein
VVLAHGIHQPQQTGLRQRVGRVVLLHPPLLTLFSLIKQERIALVAQTVYALI